MNEIPDFRTAENDLFSCAVFLTDKIRNSGGRDEAIKALADNCLEAGEVDAAAEFADSIGDNFERDRVLIAVAEKCAAIEDFDYAVQLAEAIEDKGFQSDALERIAVIKARKGRLEEAAELIENLAHAANAKSAIAFEAYKNGSESVALDTLESIDDFTVKANCLQLCALEAARNNQPEKAENFLQKAQDEALKIEVLEEKIYVLLSTAYSYGETGRKDKQIELSAQAQKQAESLDGVHRNHLLSLISNAFLDAGSIDLADKTLDLVKDKTVIASTLSAFAFKFYEKGELPEALEELEESYAILNSQAQNEVRDSKAVFTLLENIAVNFATFGKFERAVTIAADNPSENERNSALTNIARLAILQGNREAAANAVENITLAAEKTAAMTVQSDAFEQVNKRAEAVKMLDEARQILPSTANAATQISLLKDICAGFKKFGEDEKARATAQELLEICAKISDDSLKAGAIADLSTIYKKFGYELNSDEKTILREMLIKAEK